MFKYGIDTLSVGKVLQILNGGFKGIITNEALSKIQACHEIVLKKDQHSGELTEGEVKQILTKSSYHPHGIKVKLTDGQVGRVKEVLEDNFELIMPSLAGYGESSKMTAPSTIRENAIQVFELLDYLKIDTFNLLGHSMGGMIVQEMAALSPERVNKLICFGTGSIGVLPNRFETIAESRRKIKEIVYNLKCPNFKQQSIVDLDIRTKGIKLEKRSFMNLEITLYVDTQFDVKSKEIKNIIKELLENVIDNGLSDKKLFNFNVNKK